MRSAIFGCLDLAQIKTIPCISFRIIHLIHLLPGEVHSFASCPPFHGCKWMRPSTHGFSGVKSDVGKSLYRWHMKLCATSSWPATFVCHFSWNLYQHLGRLSHTSLCQTLLRSDPQSGIYAGSGSSQFHWLAWS